jgi:hypothetical protein
MHGDGFFRTGLQNTSGMEEPALITPISGSAAAVFMLKRG